jgi:hypothetical protein
VVSAMLKYFKLETYIRIGRYIPAWSKNEITEPLALIMFTLLAVYLYWDSRRVGKEE